MYAEFCEKIGYEFSNKEYLITALTHPSACNRQKRASYQRLELLGDSVLSLIVAEMLLDSFPELNEGQIAIRKADLICNKTLSKIALDLGFGKYIIMSRGEEMQDGRFNLKILEDVMESIIGAIYKDGGLEAARIFIDRHWHSLMQSQKTTKNPKSQLQEWTQKHGLPIPKYFDKELLNDGSKTLYEVQLTVSDLTPVVVSAKTKKDAEITAAKKMLNLIKGRDDEEM